jgi:phage gpG-like protein
MLSNLQRTGYEKAMKELMEAQKRCQDYSPGLERIHDAYMKVVNRNWSSEGYPKKWRPLTEAYAEWKSRVYPGRPILVQRGDLRESLLGQTYATIKDIRSNSAAFGTSHYLAEKHQKGFGRHPSRTKREVIQFTVETEKSFYRIMDDYVKGK